MGSLFCLHMFVEGSECSSLGKEAPILGYQQLHWLACPGVSSWGHWEGSRDSYSLGWEHVCTCIHCVFVYKDVLCRCLYLTFTLHSQRGQTNQAIDVTPICVTAVYPVSADLCVYNCVYTHIYIVCTCASWGYNHTWGHRATAASPLFAC